MKKVYWLLFLAPLFSQADGQVSTVSSKNIDPADFGKSVQPFFARNCYSCHNAKLKTNGLNLEAYFSGLSVTQDRDEFEKILRRIQTGEMPPKGMPRPNGIELKVVTNWIEAEFERADRIARPEAARILVRRLNRAEYNNTVHDLLGVHEDVPCVLLGRGDGARKPRRHIVYPGTPQTNLWLALLERMRVHPEKLGDNTEKLEHLTDL